MRTRTLCTLALAVALLACGGSAMAQWKPEPSPFPFIMIERAIDDDGHSPREVAQRYPRGPVEIPLHTGVEKATSFTPGPVSAIVAGMSGGTGSAIVAPAGGSFVTPRMEADRAIRRTIRLLD